MGWSRLKLENSLFYLFGALSKNNLIQIIAKARSEINKHDQVKINLDISLFYFFGELNKNNRFIKAIIP